MFVLRTEEGETVENSGRKKGAYRAVQLLLLLMIPKSKGKHRNREGNIRFEAATRCEI